MQYSHDPWHFSCIICLTNVIVSRHIIQWFLYCWALKGYSGPKGDHGLPGPMGPQVHQQYTILFCTLCIHWINFFDYMKIFSMQNISGNCVQGIPGLRGEKGEIRNAGKKVQSHLMIRQFWMQNQWQLRSWCWPNIITSLWLVLLFKSLI